MVDHRDHWLLISRMGDGKSTFASQMSPEYLVLDFDGRWNEQDGNVLGKYHLISSSDVLEVAGEMKRRLKDLKGKVGTIVVDSGTSVLDYVQSLGRMQVAAGQGNANDVHKVKADTMRVLRGALLTYHCSTIWIFHIEDNMMSGKLGTRSTIPRTELERLKTQLNAILSIVSKNGRRGIKIEWCRYYNNVAAGQVVWDIEGMWSGVPEKVSEFLRGYTGEQGYNGNAYDLEWLFDFLKDKGVEYGSVEGMSQELTHQRPAGVVRPERLGGDHPAGAPGGVKDSGGLNTRRCHSM